MATTGAAGVASLGLRKARIIAIPLVRNGTTVNTKALTYYQFQLSTQKKPETTASEVLNEKERDAANPQTRWSLPKEGLGTWAQNKAADLWASFGKAEGGWKLKVFQTGERLMDRLDFEELALKSIDPSLGPTISHPTTNDVNKDGEPLKISLLYPSSITSSEVALANLRQYADHRTPIHRRGFLTWLAIAPITVPFMIVPVVPNLPFFFCVWRSWSHYRAFRSSQYLQRLLDQRLIAPEPSLILDAIYKEHPERSPFTSTSESPESSASAGASSPPSPRPILLNKSAIPAILEGFELDPQTSADLYRAFEQARVRSTKGDTASSASS